MGVVATTSRRGEIVIRPHNLAEFVSAMSVNNVIPSPMVDEVLILPLWSCSPGDKACRI
jgi:hypothetical protein